MTAPLPSRRDAERALIEFVEHESDSINQALFQAAERCAEAAREPEIAGPQYEHVRGLFTQSAQSWTEKAETLGRLCDALYEIKEAEENER